MLTVSNAMIDAAIATCNVCSITGCGNYQCTAKINKTLVNYDVDDFFSYMVSDPKIGAQINVRIKSNVGGDYNKSCDVIHQNCLLFSGGIDSLCAYRSMDVSTLTMFIDYGESYNDLEWEFAQHFARTKLEVELAPRLPCWKYIIPMRNFIFVAIAAMHADNVYLAATAGDLTDRDPDKSIRFFIEASAILSKYYDREIQIKTPFGDMTKTDIVRQYLRSGFSEYVLKQAVTCYNRPEEGKLCGTCGACFRRACAFKNNGIHNANEYVVDPLISQRDDYLANCTSGVYKRRRVDEIMTALEA